ncbi:Phospholipase D-like domain containing protein [Comamonadaceae bacterium]
MIESIQAALLALVAAINTAKVDIRIETQALKSPTVITALESARKRGVAVQIVLGAKADFSLDARGQPTGGNRPYDTGPQGSELRALDAMKASVFIPPQFSELDRPVFEPGVEMNAAFAVIDSKWGLLCSSPFNTNTRSDICWRSSEQAFVTALVDLHKADQSITTIDPVIAKSLATKDLVVTPTNSHDFNFLLHQKWRHVVVSYLSDGEGMQALLAAPPATLWTSPAGVYSRLALVKLQRAGWTIKELPNAFSGIALISPRAVYVGSQKLDDLHLGKSRALGVLLSAKHSAQVEQLLQIK